MRRSFVLAPLACLTLLAAGCGTTEKSVGIGQTIEAEGLQVTVLRLDTVVPIPGRDVTGLSRPTPGNELVGVRVAVCSKERAAVGAFDFGVALQGGGEGTLKNVQRNYPESFGVLRGGCDDGWIVFEIPAGKTIDHVRFGYENTGSSPRPQDAFRVRFTWTPPAS